jgi:hypothetical protein
MENTGIPAALPMFVDHVVQHYGADDREPTVNDLRLGIREVRMSEIREWSNDDLDEIEVHAARFDGDEPLSCVFNLPSGGDSEPLSVASICAPSPFAWM